MTHLLTIEHVEITGDVSIPAEIPDVLVHDPGGGRHSASLDEGFELAVFGMVRLRRGTELVVEGPGELLLSPFRLIGVLPEDRVSGSAWGDCTVHVVEAKHADVEAIVVPAIGRHRKKYRDLTIHVGNETITILEVHRVVNGDRTERLKDVRPVAQAVLDAIGRWNPNMSASSFADEGFALVAVSL